MLYIGGDYGLHLHVVLLVHGSVTIRVSKTMSELTKFIINKMYIISLLSINCKFSEYHPEDFVNKSLKSFS